MRHGLNGFLSFGLLALIGCLGCGGLHATAISVSAAGLSPDSTRAQYGTDVVFENRDSADHRISSNICPDIDSGLLHPGASATIQLDHAGELGRDCDLFDALAPANSALHGSLHVLGAGLSDVPTSGN
jgi:hypothetical protein